MNDLIIHIFLLSSVILIRLILGILVVSEVKTL